MKLVDVAPNADAFLAEQFISGEVSRIVDNSFAIEDDNNAEPAFMVNDDTAFAVVGNVADLTPDERTLD